MTAVGSGVAVDEVGGAALKQAVGKSFSGNGLGVERILADVVDAQPVISIPETLTPSAEWDQALDKIKAKLDGEIFRTWILPLRASVEVGGQLTLFGPNRFFVEHLERTYGELIREALGKSPIFSIDSNLSGVKGLAVRGEAGGSRAKKRAKEERNVVVTDESNLNPKHSFLTFVVGSCNQLAHAASLQVSQHLGENYNPLFIYGGVGLGKTHLVNAVGNVAKRQGKNVLFVSSEYFVNELISSLRANRMAQFKSRFRSLDVLIVDDVQFLIGKERTLEEFFHTFNELHQKRKQIILTSDKTPQELVGLEDRLRTRFSSGLSVDMQAPDFETRVAILVKKAEAAGISLPQESAEVIAKLVTTNVRELEGALNRVQAIGALQNIELSAEFVSKILESFSVTKKVQLTVEEIQRGVAEFYRVGLADLVGKRRTQNIANARQVAMYICRRNTTYSYPEIGALFGGRDHSTVIHSVKSVEERMREDKKFAAELKVVDEALRS